MKMFGNMRKTAAGLSGVSLFRGVVPTIASLAFIVYISYLGWMALGPEKPVPDEKRQEIALRGAEKIVETLRKERGEIMSAVLMHFANDSSDFVTDTLRSLLNSSGILDLEDRSFTEKLRNKLNLVNRGAPSREAALKAAQEYKTDGIIWGRIERFESSSGGALIKGHWELLNARTGAVVISSIIDEDSARQLPAAVHREKKEKGALSRDFSASLPLPLRIAGFLLCMLMLPLVTFSFIRTLIAKRSNKINAAMLGILTVIDLILACLLVSGGFVSPAGVFLFLGAGAGGFFYNVFMLSFAKKLES